MKVCEVSISYTPQIKPSERPMIKNSNDAYNILKHHYDPGTIELCESVKVLLLNKGNKVLGVHSVSDGGIDQSIIDIKLILQAAILANASAIILSHNHPSGNLTPSVNDKRVTSKLKQACTLLDIQMLDHLIITSETYRSMMNEGDI